MKIIGIDARFLLRPLRGIPLYVTRLCQYLPLLNKDYFFYYFINKGYEHNDNPENYIPRIKNIEEQNNNVLFVNFNHDAEIKYDQYYLPKLAKYYKLDLLHMPANRTCCFLKIPVISTLHDIMEFNNLFNNYVKRFKYSILSNFIYNTRHALYKHFIYKYAYKKTNEIVTVSHNSANDIQTKLKIENSKIHTIYHGVDTRFLRATPERFSSRSYVLMLGGDSYHKNPELALNAWSRIPKQIKEQYPLKIVGFTKKSGSPIIRIIKDLKLDDDVQILGWISDEEILEYYRKAVLFLFPSRYEGFGFPPLQAMAVGTPVITTNMASIPEVVGQAALQYDPSDFKGFSEGISNILTSYSYWQYYSKSGITRASKFTWELCAKQHIEIYNKYL